MGNGANPRKREGKGKLAGKFNGKSEILFVVLLKNFQSFRDGLRPRSPIFVFVPKHCNLTSIASIAAYVVVGLS